MKRALMLGLLLACAAGAARAEGNTYGAAEYLNLGVGSRAAAMGGAFVAVAEDAFAGVWNPAGLAHMGIYLYQVGSQYAFLDQGLSHHYLSYAFQWPQVGAFGVSWIHFGAGELEARDAAGNPAGTFGGAENALLVSYGAKVYHWVRGLSLGATLKFLHHGLAGFSAAGHGLDLALLWQPVLYWDHTLGATVQNLFQRLYWDTGAVDASLTQARIGAALRFLPSDEALYYHHLVIAGDGVVTEYGRFEPHLGAEYWFLRSTAVRAGWERDTLTAGAGYGGDLYALDYAFRYDFSRLGQHQHRISLLLRFK